MSAVSRAHASAGQINSELLLNQAINKVWTAIQNNFFTDFPTSITTDEDPLRVTPMLPPPYAIAIQSKNMMIIVQKKLGEGSYKHAIKGIMCTPSPIVNVPKQKEVALWLARRDTPESAASIAEDIVHMKRYSFSRIIPRPICQFHLTPDDPLSIIVVNKLYRGDAFKFMQSLLKKNPHTFSNQDFSNLMSLFIDTLHATHYAHSRGDILCDIKPENILVEGEKHLRFNMADLGMTIAAKKANQIWKRHIQPLKTEIDKMLEDPVFDGMGPSTMHTLENYYQTCRHLIRQPRLESIKTLKKINILRMNNLFERGSPLYMPPEEINFGQLTQAKDVFAIGCILDSAYSCIDGFKMKICDLGLKIPFKKIFNRMKNSDPTLRPSISEIIPTIEQEILKKLPSEMGKDRLLHQSHKLREEIKLSSHKETRNRSRNKSGKENMRDTQTSIKRWVLRSKPTKRKRVKASELKQQTITRWVKRRVQNGCC